LAVSMGNQNKRTVDIEQTNQIAEWRESNNAWSATLVPAEEQNVPSTNRVVVGAFVF
jgi:hypothetical protein